MPETWCSDPGALSVGLQSGRSDIVRGERTDDGLYFSVDVVVKTGPDGEPDFAGPLVHGKRGDRFLYVSWGTVTATDDHAMFRRLKLYLSPVSRRDWSSPGVSWAQIEAGVAGTHISGRGTDGTPHCGSAPIHWR